MLCMAHNWSPTRPPWLCQRCSTSSKSRPPMPPQSSASGRRPDIRRPRVYLSFVLWPDLHMHWASASINNLFFGSLPVADLYLTLSSLPKTLPPLSPSHRTKAAVSFRHELQFRFVAGQCRKKATPAIAAHLRHSRPMLNTLKSSRCSGKLNQNSLRFEDERRPRQSDSGSQ